MFSVTSTKDRVAKEPSAMCLHMILVSVILMLAMPWTPILADENDDVLGDGLGTPFGGVLRGSWEESAASIPPKPKEESLLPFKVYETPAYRYFLDSASLNVAGNDNVVRYTVVIETPTGIKNMFYEGIRCDTQQYKTYAFALWGQDLNPITEPVWSAIISSGTGVYRYDLFKYYLCNSSIIRGSKKEILQLIEYPPDNFIDEELE